MKILKNFLKRIREKCIVLKIVYQYFPVLLISLITKVNSAEYLYGIYRLKVKLKCYNFRCLYCGQPLNKHKYFWAVCWESNPNGFYYVCADCYKIVYYSNQKDLQHRQAMMN